MARPARCQGRPEAGGRDHGRPRRQAGNRHDRGGARDPAATKRDILVAAREEFVEFGLDGARVDRIAERAGANKRLLYHYVGNKEALYARVLLDAYRDIREGEARAAPGRRLAPDRGDGARWSASPSTISTRNPWFIRLLAIENIQPRRLHPRPIPRSATCTRRSSGQIAQVLARARRRACSAAASIRCSSTSPSPAVSYFYFSNIHTLSVIFDRPLNAPRAKADRRGTCHRVVLGFLRSKPACPKITNELLFESDAGPMRRREREHRAQETVRDGRIT